ncbi:MAG: reverse transcriptase domain-containing protein [Phocaeicola sp.]
MRRIGYVIEEITERANMENSFDVVLRGTERKESLQGRELLANRDEVITELTNSITKGEYQVSGYRNRDIVEGGKQRTIQILTMKDRIAVHAVMNIVDAHLQKRFIRTTSASIKKRGMHDLLKYICRDIADDPIGTQYCYKFDIHKFYDSVNQDMLMESVKRVFKDKKLLAILDGFVRMMPTGISIGLRSSQGLGNLFLSEHLDHHFKDVLGVQYYYRYCDDIVVLSKAKADLWKIRDVVHQRVTDIGLKVKANERVFPIEEGIDFLGYVIYPDYVRLRKRIKTKFARKMHEVKSKRRRRELIASFYGMAKHADCIMMFNKLTGKQMKSFKDLNVSYKPDDGKKRFSGAVVSIRELVNLPIVVKDYELGIKTEQGDDRCLVSIEQNGEVKKFFTNSEEMKNILQQVSEMEGGFPFETTIKAETFGKGRTKYVFS